MSTTVVPDRLTRDQLQGWACALCGARLYRDRSLGLVNDPRSSSGEYVELWGCAPKCPPRPRSRR